MDLDKVRLDILAEPGNILVCGGPGCGKTTIALLKAKARISQLAEAQTVLFLSFSRAAVRQIGDRMQDVLTLSERKRLEVRTFHSFFMDLVRSHGRVLNQVDATFVAPDQERLLRSEFSGDWSVEARRRATVHGSYVFDQLAPAAAEIVEKSRMVRSLYSDAYPLIIVDEFQDTNVDQWRVIQALAEASTIACLADPDQRIFDHIEGVDEHRIEQAIEVLAPREFDLSKDNHRSGGSGLLDFANAVLRNSFPLTAPDAVKFTQYRYASMCAPKVQQVILAVHSHLEGQLGRPATVAVLSRTNAFLGSLSEKIAEDSTWNGLVLPAVEHELNWDPELAAAAGFVVASILEWPLQPREIALDRTLSAVVGFYRVKFDSGTIGARKTAQTIENALVAYRANKVVRSKTAKILIGAFDRGLELVGDPVRDWQVARSLMAGSSELNEMYKQVRLLRLLKATDALAWALLDSWDGVSGYVDARSLVESVLAEQAIDGGSEQTASTTLMSLHKSKGKEFDGVVIVEGEYSSFLLDRKWTKQEQYAARRLLRVGITRARHIAVFVRPASALPLVGQGWL